LLGGEERPGYFGEVVQVRRVVARGRVSEGGGVEPACKLPGAEAVVETGRRRFASSRSHPRLPLPTTGAANERNRNSGSRLTTVA
jgi:hypothetical protein